MGIKKYKPQTPGQRWAALEDFKEITKSKPEKSLLITLKRSGGRNNHGRITTRHHGGGNKNKLRIIDFKRDKRDIESKVLAIEYDPNRTSRLALLEYSDGERRYIIMPVGLQVGDKILSSDKGGLEIIPGNSFPLEHIPLGTFIHNIELTPGKGGQIVRSAGTGAQIMAKEKGLAHVRLPSGEVRLVSLKCRATIGQVGNVEHGSVSIGKAGRNRWKGIRPSVRGSAMNPVDHPHGGGEGKAGQGNPHPVTPWGKPTKGYKTRKKKKYSDRLIVRRR